MSESGFVLDRSHEVGALNLIVEEYTHPSGARHFHLSNDYAENVFMVALRTVPHDSTGVAHILEHTALCGSEKFPVRDPFFLMIRRSLNTFMNAFTTSDYTAYPFASQNRKDYFNLMDVYLDAVFFSRLHPLDFAQEGHRLEFETPDDPSTPLVHKGVVYNEMKGDTSSPMSMLYHAIQEHLYPTSTYHFNSGGDPRAIPALSYEQLMEFYRTHYHPANAIFMTFGDISAAEQQEKITAAINRLDLEAVPDIAVEPEQRYGQPVHAESAYPVDDDDLTGKTHIVVSWLLGRNSDLEMLLKCHLLSDVLLDTSASPLREALEKTNLATGASPMCGFEEDHMETNFMCGVEGSEPEHAEAVEQLIFDVLNRVAEEGIPKDRLEAVLHQLELSQREVGGDGMPFGLQLIFSCMSAAIHRGDPIGLLDLDGALSSLRAEIEDPGFIKRLVKDLLLDNPHRVRVVMKPDRTLGARLIEEEKSALQSIKDALSDEEKQQIVHLAEELNQRQAMEEDLSVLPEVTVADIPESKHFPAPDSKKIGDLQITACSAGTNGISYHQVITELPELESDLLAFLPVYTQLVTEVGSAGRGYRDTQHIQHSVSGGINAFSTIRTSSDDRNGYKGYLTLSSRTLNTKAPDMVKIVQETALKPDFDEPDRLRELIAQIASRRMNGIASNGHQYAMSAAASAFSPVAAVNEYLSGIPAAMRLKKLADSLNDSSRIEALGETLASLHERLRSGTAQFMAISDESYLTALTESVSDIWNPVEQGRQANKFVVPELDGHQDRAFVVTTQVNYCATAFPTVAESHPDAAALSVLSGVLRNNFLHSELREKGGAYGGGAGYDGSNGIFRFYSYRDPGINETFEAFERSVEWLLTNDLSDRMLEEAVLGIVSSIDAPGSPAGEIRQAFHHQLFGRDADYRQKMRSRFLHVRQDDLKRVAREYLTARPARALVTSENRLAETDNGFQVVRVNET